MVPFHVSYSFFKMLRCHLFVTKRTFLFQMQCCSRVAKIRCSSVCRSRCFQTTAATELASPLTYGPHPAPPTIPAIKGLMAVITECWLRRTGSICRKGACAITGDAHPLGNTAGGNGDSKLLHCYNHVKTNPD